MRRVPSSIAAVFAVVFGYILSGCAGESPEPPRTNEAQELIGTWSADDTTRFVFADSGEALWIFGEGAGEDTFRIQYTYAGSEEPANLDFTGFDRGLLKGRTLYCIVAFDSVSVFRLDCEPGETADSGARPDTFTHSTTTYRAVSAD